RVALKDTKGMMDHATRGEQKQKVGSLLKFLQTVKGTSSITKYFHGRNQLNASSEALDEKSVLEGDHV
ncbi:hypothetical protein Tco_0514913, partial [Tanacetum coccineum]